ncbi:MAG: UDP-N-acetylmuramoyl-tripeptide--D-alanyl-D-alanine ligase [Candidatus Atribacteria bacterium]|nr:UDP-N-acetylmuramoyl-tripeptide--D-alanyl-D-alanine ligase [Candidatus Atribacteria bacterium]
MRLYPQQLVRILKPKMVIEGKASWLEGVAIDSRECQPGQLFVALPGSKTDGALFIPDVLRKGAGGVVTERSISDFPHDFYFFQVNNSRDSLIRIGKMAREEISGTKIAITGTVGKTSCKSFFRQLLAAEFKVEATPRNYNTSLGVAYSLANFSLESDFYILEAGISCKGEMAILQTLTQPEIVVFTFFGKGHLQELETEEMVVEEKLKLVSDKTNRVYLNVDNPFWKMAKDRLKQTGKEVILFGKGSYPSDLRLSNFRLDLEQKMGIFEITWQGEILTLRAPIFFPEVASLLLPAVHFALDSGISRARLQSVLKEVKLPRGRGGVLFFKNGMVIDDWYNANPHSYLKLICFLDFLAQRGYQVWAVVGDMLELGKISPVAHRQVVEKFFHSAVDQIFIYGDRFRQAVEEMGLDPKTEKRFCFLSSPEEAQTLLRDKLEKEKPDRWAVAFKGSRAMNIEKALLPEWGIDDGI